MLKGKNSFQLKNPPSTQVNGHLHVDLIIEIIL